MFNLFCCVPLDHSNDNEIVNGWKIHIYAEEIGASTLSSESLNALYHCI